MELSYRLILALTGALAYGSASCGSDDSVTGADKGGKSTNDGPSTGSGGSGSKVDAGAKKDAGGKGSIGVNGGTGIGQPVEPDASGGGLPEGACDKVQLPAHPNAPQILVVLDRSGSMIGAGVPGGMMGTQRWDPSVKAIKALTSSLTGSVQFGLMLFPQPNAMAKPMGGGGGGLFGGGFPGGGVNECAPGVVEVPVDFNTAGMIAAKLDSSPPDMFSATPTADTLVAAKTALEASQSADNVEPPKYVLLVTDGQPNCGDGTAQMTQADVDDSNAAIDALTKAGIKTYVIGYDTAKDAATATVMNGFAMHGGTEKQYPVEDEASLVAELTRIAGSLIPCEFELTDNVSDPSFVRVEIDGQTYNYGTDWKLDGKKVVLDPMGGACPILRDAKVHILNITRECDPVL